MKNNWNPKESIRYINEYKKKKIDKNLALRIYSTHLLGREKNLVLHGGGNTSLKGYLRNISGKIIDVIYVKGSGWDMSNLNENGMPCLELKPLLEVEKLKKLDDKNMVNYLRKNLIDTTSPNPSVETLLHAFLPHKYIDHTHSSAILSIVNQKNSKALCNKVFGKKISIVPYTMPGFELAKKAKQEFNKNKSIECMILLNHGIFTFGESAKESYDRMIKYVNKAEKYIQVIFWRIYWKGWLEHHPKVWNDFINYDFEHEDQKLTDAKEGKTNIISFNSWANELKEFNYLHNHSRMWFASIWIFTLGLPWQEGAKFFLELNQKLMPILN